VNVLILGASARAAAWSALRAGLSPAAADLFADRDLARVAPCVRVAPGAYPDGLDAAADALPPGPWLYTGALENRPDLIARITRRRPLWGNDAPVARAVRDPVAVADALRAAGLPAAEVRLDPTGLPRDGSWLRKPLASAGGRGIEPLGPGHAAGTKRGARASYYYQERIAGADTSAVFVGNRAGAVLAGVTRQLIGRPGAGFAYRGSYFTGPPVGEAARRFEAVGQALAGRFGLNGLFGVDLILDADGWPRVVEVNPRYTASVEVIELAMGRSLLAEHRLACEGHPLDLPQPPPRSRDRFVAKEILFAGSVCVFLGPADELGQDPEDPFRVPRAADLPVPGTRFDVGEPVLTVFGEGGTAGDALHNLARERDHWERRLRSGPG
jgi:predicted ATP-grasp superfamily ATP-dependent carboligase